MGKRVISKNRLLDKMDIYTCGDWSCSCLESDCEVHSHRLLLIFFLCPSLGDCVCLFRAEALKIAR